MRKVKNLIGLRIGRRQIVAPAGRNDKGLHCWIYRCDCGAEGVISGASFKFGGAISCGCYDREVTLNIRTKHGMHKTPMHNLWRTIRARCHLETSKDYHHYGGRGISMHEEWRASFSSFYEYVETELGPRPSAKYSLDRINNDGNYEPNNLRWATQHAQKRNTRRNRYIEFGGMKMIYADWTNFLGLTGCAWAQKVEAQTVHTFIRRKITRETFNPNLESLL